MPLRSRASRVFRLFLKLFPAEFRADFGDDMAADFDDQRRRAGGRGAVRVWLRTLADFARRAPVEQADVLAADVRFATRMMRRHAGSTIVLVLLLALGLGANVAVFGLLDPVVRRPLPVPGGDDLVRLLSSDGGGQTFSYSMYEAIRDSTQTLSGVAAHQITTVSFGTGEASRPVPGEVVSGNYFEVYGIAPALGRLLRPDDDRTIGAHPVVVIGDGFWREAFGGSPDAIGRQIVLNGHSFEVIGVAPRGFRGSYSAFASTFWAPIAMYRQVRPVNVDLRHRGWGWLTLTGRLAPGVGAGPADDEISRIGDRVHREHNQPTPVPRYGAIRASGLPEGLRSPAATLNLFASAIGALVLLVTCANVAGVLHSRATTRAHETAVRHALGASRFRVIRQWLTEGVLLALLASIAALLMQRWVHAGVARLLRGTTPVELTLPPLFDARTVAFTVGLSLVSGVLFALLPAMRAARRGGATLRESSHALTRSQLASRSTRALVAVQIGICLSLVVAAGLLTRSLGNARAFDPGFQSEGLLVGTIDLHRLDYDRARASAFFNALAERLRATNGVVGVTRANVVPLGGDRERQGFTIPGYTTPSGSTIVLIDINAVGAGYFAAVGIPLAQGRDFTPADNAAGHGVVVINETMARRFWQGRSAVGETIVLAGRSPKRLEIVGVARDIKYYALDEAPRPYVYVPAEQVNSGAAVVHVRAAGPAGPFVNVLKREAALIDPRVTLRAVMTFEELRQQPLGLRRAMTTVATVFGALAMLLTVVGVYGTMANSVGQRAREIGIRRAFGARTADIYRLILGEGLTTVGAGVVLGVVCASLLARLVAAELFGVGVGDLATHAGAIAAIVVSALGAMSIPARRASRVDPVQTLREG